MSTLLGGKSAVCEGENGGSMASPTLKKSDCKVLCVRGKTDVQWPHLRLKRVTVSRKIVMHAVCDGIQCMTTVFSSAQAE